MIDIDRIREMTHFGVPVKEIANILGVPAKFVYNIKAKHHIKYDKAHMLHGSIRLYKNEVLIDQETFVELYKSEIKDKLKKFKRKHHPLLGREEFSISVSIY
jgi:hypothetical protein